MRYQQQQQQRVRAGGLRAVRRRNRFAANLAVCARVEPVEGRVMMAADFGAKLPPGLAKLDGALAELHADFDAFAKSRPAPGAQFRPGNPHMRTSGGLVAIDAVATGDPRAVLTELAALGLRNGAAVGTLVGGLLPISALDELAGLGGVAFARHGWAVTNAAVTHGGSTTSQADAAMQADVARATYGVNGAGSIVGVLSDSFNTSGDGSYTADQNTGDLPAGVTVLEEHPNGSDEGRAMLQLIHDVAPGAGLSFHSAFASEASFAQGITDLRNAGADVIVDDVIWLTEPMFQDGVIAKSVNAAVAAGVPYFSAAGNQARRAYESAFRAGPVLSPGTIPVDSSTNSQAPSQFFGGTAHDFDAGTGVDHLQQFTLGANETIQLTLQWDSPYRSAGPVGSHNDVDVYVLNSAGTTIVGGAADFNIGRDPTEIVFFRNTTGGTATFNLMIASSGKEALPGFVKYINFGAHRFNEHNVPSGTVFGHANAAGASAVAAAFYGDTPEFGVNPPLVEDFSSRGNTRIFFDGNGNRLATPVVRDKPRLTAPDGTNTTFFGGDISDDADSFPNFFGTSAAAPHAAAVAALMQDAATSTLTPAAIYDALESTALDMDNPDLGGFQTGRDDATGFGLIRADRAVQAVRPSTNPSATPGTPDLTAATDTGSSSTDNLTHRDNGAAARDLEFVVPGTVSGATVTVYADGVAVGSAVANGTTTTVRTNGTTDLADGVRAFTARQAEPGVPQSAASPALNVTIDTAGPAVDVIDVSPDPRETAVDSIDIQFSEAVVGFDVTDLVLSRNGGANLLTGSETLTASGTNRYTLSGLAGLTGAPGDYTLSVEALTSDIKDVAGNAPTGGASDVWKVASAAAPDVTTLRAAADTYARDGTFAGTNFGAATELVAKRSATVGNTRETFLRFDLSSVGSIGTAKLRLFGRLSNTTNPSVTTTVFNSSNNTWGESTLTWNNRPAAGTTSRGSITVSGTTARWYELNLTTFLKAERAAGRNVVTLVLKNGTATDSQVLFNSDEAAANRPELVVTPAGQEIVVSPTSLNVAEGGTASFGVSLAVQPASDVTVTVAKVDGGDPDLTTATTSLTFTPSNWNVAQSVTVAAAEDADTANGAALFTLSSSGLATRSVSASEADNDAPAGPAIVRAVADTYVRSGTFASTNFGNANQLQVKQASGNYARESYLRFDLSGVSTITSAKLRLFGKLDNTQAASAGFRVFNSTNTTWSETGVTWNSKLTSGTTIRASGTVTGTTGKWYELDLTSFLKAEKAAGRNLVTLVLKASAANPATILFDSDEGTNRPELRLT